MNLRNLYFDLAKTTVRVFSEHKTAIETAIGIGAMGYAYIKGIEDTPKAIKKLEERKREINYQLAEEARKEGHSCCNQITYLPKTEVVKTVWKTYLPSAVMFIAGAGCVILAENTNCRHRAALTAALELSEAAAKSYKDKVIETYGEQGHTKIKDAIAKDIVEATPISESDVEITGKGDTLCLDATTGRTFRCDIDYIRKAASEINRRLIDEIYIPLNDFYDMLNLRHGTIGEDLGWEVGRKYLDIDFSAQLNEHDQPCLVISYEVIPTRI